MKSPTEVKTGYKFDFGGFALDFTISNHSTMQLASFADIFAEIVLGVVSHAALGAILPLLLEVNKRLDEIDLSSAKTIRYLCVVGAIFGYGWVTILVDDPRMSDFVHGLSWPIMIVQSIGAIAVRLDLD